MRLNIIFLERGLTAKCDTGTCTRMYFWPIKYLNLKDEIEDEALMITSNVFSSAVLAFGPIRPEEE